MIGSNGLDLRYLPLAAAFLLSVPNWLLESLKWRVSLYPVQRISIAKSVMGVLRGIPPSMFTPNRVGEAIGRPSVLDKGNRISGALATAYCGFSQMPVMLLLGSVSCFYFYSCGTVFADGNFLTAWWFVGFSFLVGLVLLAGFMFPKYAIPFVKNSDRAAGFRQKLHFFCQYQYLDKNCIIFLSLARYIVYSTQNYLTMLAVGIQIGPLEGLASVFVIYMLMSFVPRPALAELGVRCSATVLVLSPFMHDYTLPTISSVMLWGVNLLIPSLIGASLYLVGKKDEKKVAKNFVD